MISPGSAQNSAKAIADAIDQENRTSAGRGKIYPVFINWNSELFSSYGRHLIADEAGVTSFQQLSGDKASRFTVDDLYMGPAKFLGDLGAGISKAPVNLVRSAIRSGRKRLELVESKAFQKLGFCPIASQFRNDLVDELPEKKNGTY